MIQKQIVMAGPAPAHRVVVLVDAIDKAEELCYVDDGILVETPTTCLPASVLKENKTMDKDVIEETLERGQGSGLKVDDPIELESINIEQPGSKLPLSLRGLLVGTEKLSDESDKNDALMPSQGIDALPL
jgi:hypothetical protein